LALAALPAPAADFYVAPDGIDGRSGGRDQPLATLAAARDAARKAGAGPHRIVVLPGEYYLPAPLELDPRDNGLTIEAAAPGRATLYGGRPLSGWRKDGDRFWTADAPGVKQGAWDFRALVVGDRMPARARMPETGALLHLSKFDVPWLSSVGGGWARTPTREELTTLRYDPKDIPATFDPRNAEVRVYHMWDESLVGVSARDEQTHTLLLAPPAKSPPGAFGVKKYVIFNTREGMTRPGQWYLDRSAGRVVYWPLDGEDMTKMRVIAPTMERVIRIAGTAKARVEKITLRGLRIEATNTPLAPAGFAAGAYDGAVAIEWAKECVVEKLEIANVGGQGVQSKELLECRIRDSHIHHTGACGVRSSGTANLVSGNHIHHVGVYHPSAVALQVAHDLRAGDKGFHVYRNEIHDGPYSGVIGSGGGHLIEENLIYRVMREMQDGGAIYGGMRQSILRGNMVRDVVKQGEGYGVSSYYLDEGAQDSIVERNVSIGVERPTHNHIASRLIIRDNVFVSDAGMSLSFQRSGDCIFTGNTLFAPGGVSIAQPGAIKKWENNIVYRDGVGKGGAPQTFTISDAMPPVVPPARRTYAFPVERAAKPPVIDGEIGWDEWPGRITGVDREPSRWNAAGAPAFARFGYDDRFLYVAVNTAVFNAAEISKGSEWGKDDGAEVAIGGRNGVVVLRGFAGGATMGRPESVAADVRFASKPYGNTARGGWRGEWAIPFEALGLKPAPGQKIPFNLTVYRAQDGVWRCLEGTLGDSSRLEEAAVLQLK
jgi:hypothetical protein